MGFVILASALANHPESWAIMDESTACVELKTDGHHMTCAFPRATSYDLAFGIAAESQACSATAATEESSLKPCYDETLCRFCFHHPKEFYAVEAALGKTVPQCTTENTNLACPTSAALKKWHESNVLHKVHMFWKQQ